jgi:ribosomal protein S13
MITVQISKSAYKSHKASGTLDRYRASLIEALIAKKYSIGAEIALTNDKDIKLEEYAAYQAYRAECKERVDGWFTEMEQAEK